MSNMNDFKKLEELVVAGFGGQGVFSLGMTLAYAEPEMRRGTANCITILSKKKICSPIISFFDTATVLNQPSMDKFATRVKPGRLLLYESGNILKPSTRTDIQLVGINTTTEALLMKNAKIMNMIILGAYLHLKPV